MRIPEHALKVRDTLVQTLFVGRREGPTGVQFFGENIQIDAEPVVFDPQGSPDPIRQSFYSGEGGAPTERSATVPVALHFNIGGILGVMEDTFLAGKVKPLPQSVRVRQGHADGGQLPFTTREVITPGDSAPYGNRVAIQPTRRAASPFDVNFGGLDYSGIRRRV
jgi:hypothetical protein